jgi:hypothetical protein
VLACPDIVPRPGSSEVQKTADLVEDVEGCSGIEYG